MSRQKKKSTVPPGQGFLDFVNSTKNGESILGVYRSLGMHVEKLEQRDATAIYRLCPKNSVLEHVVDITVRETDLPPSLTYHATTTMLSAVLTQEGFYIRFPDGNRLNPNLWTLALAPSGAGKTWTRSNISSPVIAEGAKKVTNMELETLPETLTAAAMFEYFIKTDIGSNGDIPGFSQSADDALSDRKRRRCAGLFVRDEVGEFIKRINHQESQAELKDYLLRAYDGSTLRRSTKKDGDRETSPINLSMFGSAPIDTFFDSLTPGDFLNGFMQRFLMVLANDRPEKRISWYTTHGVEAAQKAFIKSWERAMSGPREYVVRAEAMEMFDSWFHKSLTSEWKNSESYFRRYVFSSFKYALILKSITSPDGFIDAPIMSLSLDIVDRHLRDLYEIMRTNGQFSEWHQMLSKVEVFLERNPNADRGGIRRGVRGIADPNQLDKWLEVIAEMRDDNVGKHAKLLLTQRRQPRARAGG